jgi:ABC-type transport system substrate-binding protein
MSLQRRRLLQGAAAVSVWPATGKAAPPKVLHIAFPTPESTFDPPQTNSDRYSNEIIAQILESPLGYDYLARPVQLVPVTAAALPEVSADGRTFTLRLKPGIYFADDPAFKGRRRELVAEDYVYAIKRFYDPQYNSADLYLYEGLKLPGLSELRQKALKTRQPFEYDTPVEGVRALDRYTLRVQLGETDPRFVYRFADPASWARWRARWWSSTARTSARTPWAQAPSASRPGGARRASSSNARPAFARRTTKARPAPTRWPRPPPRA